MAAQDEEVALVTVSDPSLLAVSDVSAVALDFKVLHPVVITRLGVFPSGIRPELQSNVTVKLLQLDQEVRRTRRRVDDPGRGSSNAELFSGSFCRRPWSRLASAPPAPGP